MSENELICFEKICFKTCFWFNDSTLSFKSRKMCGIFCELLIRNHENSDKKTSQLKSNVLCKCRQNLENRGPDSVCGKIVDEIELFGTVSYILLPLV